MPPGQGIRKCFLPPIFYEILGWGIFAPNFLINSGKNPYHVPTLSFKKPSKIPQFSTRLSKIPNFFSRISRIPQFFLQKTQNPPIFSSKNTKSPGFFYDYPKSPNFFLEYPKSPNFFLEYPKYPNFFFKKPKIPQFFKKINRFAPNSRGGPHPEHPWVSNTLSPRWLPLKIETYLGGF